MSLKGDKEIPEQYAKKRLREICTYSKGKKPKVLSSEIKNEINIPYINIKAFEKGIFDEYTDGEKCNLCEDGDLLMVWDGARAGFSGKAKKGAVGSTLMKIEPKEEVLKNYLFYFLLSLYKKLNTNPRGVGIPHVEPALLWNSELLVPSRSEQQSIVSKIEELFSELDNSVAQLKQAQQQLKTYRQSVLKAAFEGRLTEEWRKNNLSSQGPEPSVTVRNHMGQLGAEAKVEYQRKNELPEGWRWTKLKEVCSLITDGKHGDCQNEENSGFYFLSAKDIRNGTLIYKGSRQITKKDFDETHRRTNLKPGDICLINTGATIGRISIAPDNEKTTRTTFQKSVAILKVIEEKLINKFLYYILMSDVKKLVKVSGGTAVPNLLLGTLKEHIISLPLYQEQIIIVSEIESRLSVADKLEETIKQSMEQAEALRQGILKEAFEGKLVS